MWRIERCGWAVGIVALYVAGTGYSHPQGCFGLVLNLPTALAIAVVGAAVGGALLSPFDPAAGFIAGAVAGLGGMLSVALFLGEPDETNARIRRGAIMVFAMVGALPGVVVYWLLLNFHGSAPSGAEGGGPSGAGGGGLDDSSDK